MLYTTMYTTKTQYLSSHGCFSPRSAQLYQQPQAALLRHTTICRSRTLLFGSSLTASPQHRNTCSNRRNRHQVHAFVTPESSGDFDPSSSKDNASSKSSTNSSSTPLQPKPFNPRPLDATTAQQLQKHFTQLLPQRPASTPLAPFIGLLVPLVQPQLQQLHPRVLLGLLQLCHWVGFSPNAAWLVSWAAAVQQQLARLDSDTACQLVFEVLQVKQQDVLLHQLMDVLFVGALKDVESCSSKSIAMALAAVAAAELTNGDSSDSINSGGSSSSSSAAPPQQSTPPAAAAAAVAMTSQAAEASSSVAAAAAAAAAASKPPDFAAADAAAPPASYSLADIAAANTAKAAAAAALEPPLQGAAADTSSDRPSSFASLVGSTGSGSTGSTSVGSTGSTVDSSSTVRPSSPVGPLSSWEELAAAAADVKPDAAAATAKQQQVYAAEAAAAGAAAAAASNSNSEAQFWLSNTNSINTAAGATSNVSLASWMAGYDSSSSSSASQQQQQQLASTTQLLPVVLHSWISALGGEGRMQQLQPEQVVLVAAAVAALQLRLPPMWMDRFCAALQQQLPALSGDALGCLSTCLPLLLPVGGSMRLWKRLGTILQQQGSFLSAAQLCEVLPLVQAADLAASKEWINTALDKIQGSILDLTLPQSSRALVAAVALGITPTKPWLDCYLQRFKTGLSQLNPEGLVDVLRALSVAGALPSHDWLLAFEKDVGRRFGFIGPVELSTSAFLFANLAHIPSDTWKQRFLAESLKFRVYYTGADLTQIVWSVVRLGCKPDAAWLQAYTEQMRKQLHALQAYQLAFTFAALQTLGAPLTAAFIDDVLDAFVPHLAGALPSDTALLLATVARLQHVSSYRWLEEVLDSCQVHMLQYDGQELVTLLWSLAQLHHQPGPEWLSIFCEAAMPHLPSMTGAQLSQLMWAFGQLQWLPPEAFMDAFLAACQARLATDAMSSRDAASLLSSLANLQHTPPETWLHVCLNLIHWRLRELDPEGLASVPVSLAKLNVIVSNGAFLDNYISMTTARLSSMKPESQVQLLSALAVFGADLPRAWVAAFQLMCVKQAEEGTMSAAQLEQVLVALSSRGQAPSSALCQLYYDASLPQLTKADPSSIASILQALQRAAVQPDAAWLESLVSVVRSSIRSYSLLQLNVVAKALSAFQAGGMRQPWLSDFVAYLKEFFLH